ncbi:MAG: ATP-binding cassette domain-containing protein [Clostridia bacterium]|nr:ATP-binding cassette domain-containing protein [Clostridia bacterium]
MDALRIKDLSFRYPKSERYALDQVSLSVKEGEFVLLCGHTGCGKTTLLRLIKSSLAPHGELKGEIEVYGKQVSSLSLAEEATSVGMVMQRPESQIVSEKAIDELAFGLCSLGVPTTEIHRRTAEVSGYFGMDSWVENPVSVLSGGQKQILNLASVIAMRPGLLLLDEPTSRLDPISASDFISAVTRLNRETGITVIMAEHRLESAFPFCDRVLFMDRGRIAVDAPPQEAAKHLAQGERSSGFLPPVPRIFALSGIKGEIPLDVRSARELLSEKHFEKRGTPAGTPSCGDVVLEAKDVFFRYEKNAKDVINGAGITVRKGEVIAVMGGNAAGKTTFLKCCAGLLKPYDGQVRINGKKISSYSKNELYGGTVAYLPQDVNAVFTCSTVADELASVGVCREDIPDELKPYADTHPYDLSGGEQQLCAIAKMTAKKPSLVLFDEPTKGLDPYAVSALSERIKRLTKDGAAVVTVTHDAEFASVTATGVMMMFGGDCSEKETPDGFFCGNSFYTTSAARISKGTLDGIYTSDELVKALKTEGTAGK